MHGAKAFWEDVAARMRDPSYEARLNVMSLNLIVFTRDEILQAFSFCRFELVIQDGPLIGNRAGSSPLQQVMRV